MSRRSPSNERYQKYTGPKGQTRKSASQAKPVRKEGSSTTSASSKSKSKSKPTSATAPGGKYYEPTTPEYVFWRRLWWISLGVGLVLVAVSFYFQYYLKALPWSRTAGVVAIGLSYAAIIAAFFIDYRKLRPMRKGTFVSTKPPKPVAAKPAKPAEPPAEDSSDADDSGEFTP